MFADHVEADEHEAFFPDHRADLGRDPALALAEFDADSGSASGEVSPRVTFGRHTRQRVGQRLAVNQQHALVTVADLRQKALRHDEATLVAGHGLEDDVGIGLAFGDAKYGRAAHAIQGLDDDLLLDIQKLVEPRHLTGYQLLADSTGETRPCTFSRLRHAGFAVC